MALERAAKVHGASKVVAGLGRLVAFSKVCLRPFWRSLSVSIFALVLFCPSLFAASSVGRPHTRIEILAESSSLQIGSTGWIGVQFTMEPKWHIYWKNSGDSGTRPKFNWSEDKDIVIGPPAWPTPERHLVGPLMNYGYANQVMFLFPVEATPSIAGRKNVKLNLSLQYLICSDVCIPGKAELDWTFDVSAEKAVPEKALASVFNKARKNLPAMLPAATRVFSKVDGEFLDVRVQPPPADVRWGSAYLFFEEENFVSYPKEQVVSVQPDHVQIRVPLSGDRQSVPSILNAVLVGTGGAFQVQLQVEQQTQIWLMLLLAFAGGLLLNLMPCVFPVLSIKAVQLAEKAHSDLKSIRILGLWYLAGVLSSFWLLAGALVGLRSIGLQVGWGFQLQSPVFVVVLVVVLFLMGLSLLGIFEFGGSFQNLGGPLARKQGALGSFFTGFLATIVSTPCTAPFMGPALAFGLSESGSVTFLIFTSLGTGLAVPYLLLTTIPWLASRLPKPGVWMDHFKQAMAWPLFFTAIWLIWVVALQVGPNGLGGVLAGLVGISMGVWASKFRSSLCKNAGWLVVWLSILAAMASAWSAQNTGNGSSSGGRADHQKNVSWSEVESRIAKGEKLFVDFTAAWCVTCKVNEQVAIDRPAVKAAMLEKKVSLVVIDWTNYDPEITEALARFGRTGVPLYLLYNGQPASEPKILPQLLTEKLLLDEIEAL